MSYRVPKLDGGNKLPAKYLPDTLGLTTEQVQDTVAAMVRAGTNVTGWTYDDTAGTLTLNVGGTTDTEVVRDTIASALVGGTNITVTANDAADTITITTTATVNATDAALRDRSTHTGTQSLDTTTDSATRLALTSAERTKLTGVASGATANSADATLLARANHTGTQAASTVTGLATVATSGAYTDLSGKPTIPTTPADIGAQPAGSYATTAGVAAQLATVSSVPVFRPIGSGVQPVTGTSPTATGTLAGGNGVKRVVPAVALKSFIVKWGNFTVGGQEASTTSTTLSAATTAGATSITTAASIAAGSRIIIDTGANTEIGITGTPTGTGPYTIPLTTASLFAHSTGVAITVDYGDITIQDATVEYPSGTFTQLYFNGDQSTVMKAGGIVTSDEIALDIPAGAPFWVRTWMSWTAGAFVALSGSPIANGQTFGLYNTTPADKTRLPGSVGGDTLGPAPIAVLGRVAPTVAALLIVGDSIATGQGDYPDIFRGYVGIATDGVVPVQKICGPSNRAMYDAANVTRWRKARLAPGTTCAYEAHGINDITAGGRTLAQIQADKLTIWSWLRAIPGMRNIYTGTLVPFTASTDGWMTTGSQTISNATFETIRTGLNDWMRDGAPVVSAANLTAVATGTGGALRAGSVGHPLTGCIDIADTVEANAAGALTRNGGRWYAPGTIRTVTDAAMTSGTKILTSATAAFTSADVGSVVAVNGAGTAGGIYTASISVVTSATQVTLAPASGANAATTVSGATAKIGGWTPDGTHPGTPAHTAMAAALTAALSTLTA